MNRTLLTCCLIAAATLLTFAIPTRPDVSRCAAIFSGRVFSTEKVEVVTDAGRDSKWELWRAQVRIRSVFIQDTNFATREWIYYEQNHTNEHASYIMVCPPRPFIAIGQTNRFYCLRRNVGSATNALFVPENGWILRL